MGSFTFRIPIQFLVVPQGFKTVIRFILTSYFFIFPCQSTQLPLSSSFWYEHLICLNVLVFSWQWEPCWMCFPVRAACLKEAESTCLSICVSTFGLITRKSLWDVNNSFNIIKKIFVFKSICKSSDLERRSYQITADFLLTWTLSSKRDPKQWYISSPVCLLSQLCCENLFPRAQLQSLVPCSRLYVPQAL